MSSEIYEIVSLAARYWFAALGVLIIWRAWRCTVLDNRHAKILRDWTPQTGAIGELLIAQGSGGARRGTRFSLLKESLIGSGRACDISIKSPGVMKRHAMIELREGGLLVSAMHGARVGKDGEELSRQVFLQDGEALTLGGVSLRLTLYDAPVVSVGGESDMEMDDTDDYYARRAPVPQARRLGREGSVRRAVPPAYEDDDAGSEPLTPEEQAFLDQVSSKPKPRR